jgi:hypothetical protein
MIESRALDISLSGVLKVSFTFSRLDIASGIPQGKARPPGTYRIQRGNRELKLEAWRSRPRGSLGST